MIKTLIRIISNNKVFFTVYLLFLIVGAATLLTIDKGDAILFFNDHRTAFWNFYFKYGTKLGEEPAYLACAILLLFLNRKAVWTIPAVGLSTMAVAYALKRFFRQARPSLWFEYSGGGLDQLDLVEGVTLLTGASSFPSGHSSSAFALYGLMALLIKNKTVGGFILIWIALTIVMSRVYLVQHFFRDVYVGSMVGLTMAMLMYMIFEYLNRGRQKESPLIA